MAVDEGDEIHLRRAFQLAGEARDGGNHPFGALVTDADGVLVAEARNSVVTEHDPTGHAETNAVRAAGRTGRDLAGATLYTSTEPCAMCAGAIYWSGIGRVVYGLAEVDLLDLTGAHPENPTLDLPCRDVFAHGARRIVVEGPTLADEARQVHAGFWT